MQSVLVAAIVLAGVAGGALIGLYLARLRAAQVELVAGRLLDEKGRALASQAQQRIEALLEPVAERLRHFEAAVQRTYDQENRDRAALLQSLRALQETQQTLHRDAESLTRALTGDAKVQGDWGEIVLERVLEMAGLAAGRDYELQVARADDEGGRRRPDAVVHLPGDRAIVIDAKCSLSAFVAATRAETQDARDAAVDAHIESVRSHVRVLAGKAYHQTLEQRTLEFVVLFVPNEAAFQLALSRDSGLYEDAVRQGVVLCSPWTLLAALQLVAHLWRSEKQNANAQRIAEEAGKLLEKLGAFVADLDAVGLRLRQAQQSLDDARTKLSSGRGNVLRRASEIARLGAPARPDRMEHLLAEEPEETA